METNISTNFSSNTPYNGLDINLNSLQAERTAAAAVTTRKSMDVQLVTAEGDKVTISMDARMAAFYGVSETAEMNRDRISYQKTELSLSLYEREMSFSVEGDLSAAEMRDIRKALKTLDRMLNQTVHGNFKPMLAKAEKLQGLENISSMEAQLSSERTVLVAQQTKIAAVSGPVDVAEPPAGKVSEAALSPVLKMSEKADAVGDAIIQELKAFETPMARMRSFIDQLLDDYRKQMAEFDPAGFEMVDRVADRLRDALDRMTNFKNNSD